MVTRQLFKVLFVDIFTLLTGLLSVFFLPKVVSVEEYAYYRTFSLFITYAGMFHLGFSDGIYIKFGGEKFSSLNKSQISSYYKILMIIVSIFTIGLLSFSLINNNRLLVYFSLYILPFNLIHFYKLLYRATGEFGKYSILQGLQSLLNLLPIVLFLILSFKKTDSLIVMQLIGLFFIAILLNFYLVIKDHKNKQERKTQYKQSYFEIKSIITIGITVMIANVINTLFYSIDRWLVKMYFSTAEFAYYSFAVSILSLFLVLISSLTNFSYSFLARADKNLQDTNIKNSKLKIYLLIFSFLFLNVYFLMELIIGIYLPKYIHSLSYISILFMTLPFMGVINVLYSNLYKAQKRLKEFFITVSCMLILSSFINLLLIYIYKSVYVIALGTLISFIIWYIISSYHFKELRGNFKEYTYILLNLISFFTLNLIEIYPLGLIMIGVSINLVITFFLYKKEFQGILLNLKLALKMKVE